MTNENETMITNEEIISVEDSPKGIQKAWDLVQKVLPHMNNIINCFDKFSVTRERAKKNDADIAKIESETKRDYNKTIMDFKKDMANINIQYLNAKGKLEQGKLDWSDIHEMVQSMVMGHRRLIELNDDDFKSIEARSERDSIRKDMLELSKVIIQNRTRV